MSVDDTLTKRTGSAHRRVFDRQASESDFNEHRCREEDLRCQSNRSITVTETGDTMVIHSEQNANTIAVMNSSIHANINGNVMANINANDRTYPLSPDSEGSVDSIKNAKVWSVDNLPLPERQLVAMNEAKRMHKEVQKLSQRPDNAHRQEFIRRWEEQRKINLVKMQLTEEHGLLADDLDFLDDDQPPTVVPVADRRGIKRRLSECSNGSQNSSESSPSKEGSGGKYRNLLLFCKIYSNIFTVFVSKKILLVLTLISHASYFSQVYNPCY